MNKHWQLPDGVDELLPPKAEQAETLRRRLLDLFRSWSYELVFPPIVEFLDSLTIGPGDDLLLSTLQVTDQISGRMLGLRADISSQVARMDASSLPVAGPQRLCYAGSVLLARPPASGEGRCPIKIGAELYGHQGIEADIEILSLIVETLKVAASPPFHIELGHAKIFRGLIASLMLSPSHERQLFNAIQAKSVPDAKIFLTEQGITGDIARWLEALPNLMGGAEVLDEAASLFVGAPESVTKAVAELAAIADALEKRLPSLVVTFDFSELRGHYYHTGVMYTAYADDLGRPIAKGGRYDGIGAVFGRSRPATGFDADLKVLIALSQTLPPAELNISAPWPFDDAVSSAALDEKIRQLRNLRHKVQLALPGAPPTPEDWLLLKWAASTSDWRLFNSQGDEVNL